MASEAHYIVTGAAGHLGSTILMRLKDRNCRVRALLSRKGEPRIKGENIQYFHGDVADKASLEPLFQDFADSNTVVIHTAAVISIQEEITERMYRTNVLGVRSIVDECIQHGVGRLVHVSSVHAIPELPKGTVQTEIRDYDPEKVVGGYAKTKAMGARSVMESLDKLDAVIVLPSGIIGPYDDGRNHLVQLAKEYLSGALPAIVDGGYDFADVRDVADGCLAACEKGRRGESYILSGHYLTIAEMLGEVAAITGKKILPKLPLRIARAALPFVSLYCRITGRRPLYTAYSLHTLESNALFSHDKASRELGYSSRDPKETIKDMVEYLRRDAFLIGNSL